MENKNGAGSVAYEGQTSRLKRELREAILTLTEEECAELLKEDSKGCDS